MLGKRIVRHNIRCPPPHCNSYRRRAIKTFALARERRDAEAAPLDSHVKD